MKSNYKIIFVDIDWTIFDHSTLPSTFDMKSIEYLKKLQQKGVKVFICTSRPYHSVEQIKFFEIFKPDGMVLANGGLLIVGDKIVYSQTMDVKLFEKVSKFALEHNFNVEGIRNYDAFIIREPTIEMEYVFKAFPERIPKIDSYQNQKVICCSLFAGKEYDELIQKEIGEGLRLYRYHDYALEISTTPLFKSEGVIHALEYLSIPKEEAIGIGDDEPDIPMFENVGYSIALGNAKDTVKEKASYVTKSVSDHGVYLALKKIFAIR